MIDRVAHAAGLEAIPEGARALLDLRADRDVPGVLRDIVELVFEVVHTVGGLVVEHRRGMRVVAVDVLHVAYHVVGLAPGLGVVLELDLRVDIGRDVEEGVHVVAGFVLAHAELFGQLDQRFALTPHRLRVRLSVAGGRQVRVSLAPGRLSHLQEPLAVLAPGLGLDVQGLRGCRHVLIELIEHLVVAEVRLLLRLEATGQLILRAD